MSAVVEYSWFGRLGLLVLRRRRFAGYRPLTGARASPSPGWLRLDGPGAADDGEEDAGEDVGGSSCPFSEELGFLIMDSGTA